MTSAPPPPIPQSWMSQGDCAGAVTVEVARDGTFGFALAADATCEGAAPSSPSGGSCTMSFDFAPLPMETTFVVESASVDVVGTPGAAANVTLAAFWPGDDDLIGLTTLVVIGDDGTATLTYRRAAERASYACPNFPQVFVHTAVGASGDGEDRGQQRFAISAVRNVALSARPCVPAEW